MKRKLYVSVIILTKNRMHLLESTLLSLLGQMTTNDEIIIVDNESTDQTKELVYHYKEKLPIKYYYSRISGFPSLYNFGTSKCSKNIIIFLDDDCIADQNYISSIKSYYLNHGKEYVMQGKTYSIPQGNIYADIMGNHYQNWIKVNLENGRYLNTVDNKNLAMFKTVFEKAHGFDNKLILGSEDVDLGYRLKKMGMLIELNDKAYVYHHERETFKSFLIQHKRIARSEKVVNRITIHNYQISKNYRNKIQLHLLSFIYQEFKYLINLNLTNFFYLPFLYLLLIIIRIRYFYL